MDNFKQLVAEYPEEYCLFLEGAYGQHMLSEGGTVAVDRMFIDTPLQHQTILDIGFGLGGAAFHLADTHHADVTGIELNPWMVIEAARRTPPHLKSRVRFVQYQQPSVLPFPNQHFDVVYSKGVLVHLHHKLPLFADIHRVLKPGGCLIIDDWLSPVSGQWGERLQKMCDMENLTLHAQTEAEYKHIFECARFSNIQMRDENAQYAEYNVDIVNRLKDARVAKLFCERFGAIAWEQAIEAYQLIADSISDQELLIRGFKAWRL